MKPASKCKNRKYPRVITNLLIVKKQEFDLSATVRALSITPAHEHDHTFFSGRVGVMPAGLGSARDEG